MDWDVLLLPNRPVEPLELFRDELLLFPNSPPALVEAPAPTGSLPNKPVELVVAAVLDALLDPNIPPEEAFGAVELVPPKRDP